jgi:hypothetical protein
MIVVLASRADAPARALVDRWTAAGHPTALMTCVDLALAGWQLEIGRDEVPWRGVVDARAIAAEDVTAVVNRLPAVTAREVDFIDDQDRAYAAAEMQAFLVAWLGSLRCPVLNRPTPAGLNGPAWTVERWTLAAAAADMPTHPVKRRAVLEAEAAAAPPVSPLLALDVVGRKCLGEADARTRKAALALAASAGVELLRVHVEPIRRGVDTFVHADYWIDVGREEVADALLERCAS